MLYECIIQAGLRRSEMTPALASRLPVMAEDEGKPRP